MLRETIEDVEPGDPEYELLEDLGQGLYDNDSPERPLEFLENEVARKKKQKQDKMRDYKASLLKLITV